MLAEIARQLLAHERHRVLFGDVVGIEQRGGIVTAQIPEKTLLGNALGHPPHEPPRHALHPATILPCGVAMTAVTLGFRQHLVEVKLEEPEDPQRIQPEEQPCPEPVRQRLLPWIVMRLRLVDVLAIKLVCVAPDRNEEDIHGD